MRQRRFCCVFAAIFPVLLHAEIVEFKLSSSAGEASFEKQFAIPPGKFAEACVDLKLNDSVHWSFEVQAPVKFNVHYHVGKDVIYLEKRKSVLAAQATLLAPIAQTYCWMWSNPSTTDAVKLTFSVKRT